MHFAASQTLSLKSKMFPTSYCASDPTSKVKGIAILIHKNCQFQAESIQRDPDGRYVFVKGIWHGVPVTLVNVYYMLSQLQSFAQRMLIMWEI